MEPVSLYSILTFPQSYESGVLYFNIMVLPRNINLLEPIEGDLTAFADTYFQLETQIINHPDGLPLFSSVTDTVQPHIDSLPSDKKEVILEIIRQMEQNDGLKISDDKNLSKDHGAHKQMEELGNISIRKYLPLTYRKAFNFTNPRTRFAITDDEYHCIIKNKDKKITDAPSKRDYISWGKFIAFIIRNPLLAEKAGLIYKSKIPIKTGDFEKGGWLFAKFAQGSSYQNVETSVYAAKIPALKDDRKLFASVLFPVKETAANNSTYDAVMQESILYNDGFAKIVHASQPVNQDFLQETDVSNPPLKDIGLRLAWDDEQLTIWGNRQLRQKDEITDLPVDAPLGVFGYKIDVREKPVSENPDNRWFSQNMIQPNQDIVLGNGERIAEMNQSFELPVEVHPSSHGNTKEEGFWLPIYFASWNGKSVVIPDKDAAEIHRLNDNRVPVNNLPAENAVNYQPDKRTFYPYHQDETQKVPLLYGKDYQFRIRLSDISGGGPEVKDNPLNGGQKQIADVHFIRNVKAGTLQILNITETYDQQNSALIKDTSILENILGQDSVLRIKRPDLSYPSVAFTGKYSNAEELLKTKINSFPVPTNPGDRKEYTIGLPDPDVKKFKILVDVKSLEMDNVLSKNGKEPFIPWQEKIFDIPYNEAHENYEMGTEIKIVYRDFDNLQLGAMFTDDTADILVLPTSRETRITFIPIVGEINNEDVGDYVAEFAKSGTPLVFSSFKAAESETDFISKIKGGLRAFYLQPEQKPDLSAESKIKLDAVKIQQNQTSVELQRLADALNLNAHNLTLESKKGLRTQFGVSNGVRHSLSPESGSVTLSGVNELFNHWIVALDYSILRDWAWKGLKEDSFKVERKITGTDSEFKEIGSIRMKDVANMSMLNNPERDTTRMVFLDTIDPKKFQHGFPEEISAEYKITPNFINESTEIILQNEEQDILGKKGGLKINLPITIIPQQLPKLVSAGTAMTPYQYDKEKYRYSDERRKYLWLEFDEPPLDPKDTYFARVLAYAPDPYLCRMNENLVENLVEDMPFNLNEEKIREIIPGMNNDYAGIGVMQELIPENGEHSKTYLLPLPEGLHPDSDELFGFFTYEIRIGHKKEFWSTAQGRYGRPLKVNGVQHPAPELVCSAFRSESRITSHEKYIEISAAHANAVLNGENVTAFPPNTSLWYLLYAQVMQADGKSFRNILVDSGPMFYHPPKIKLENRGFSKESGNRFGTAKLRTSEVGDKLENMGLPRSNSLSVVAVEMFPLENKWQYNFTKKRVSSEGGLDQFFLAQYAENQKEIVNPLTDNLGRHRIYRSSKLVPVSEVCCEDC